MEAIEFKVKSSKPGQIEIPDKFQKLIKPECNMHVIILFEEGEEEQFKHLAAEQFIKGYADNDSIYDAL